MLQPDVPFQIVTPEYLFAPFKGTDAMLARDILPESVLLVCGPEVAVDGLGLCPLLAATLHGALAGESVYPLVLSVGSNAANVRFFLLDIWIRMVIAYRSSNFFSNVRKHEEKLQGYICFGFGIRDL